MKLALFAHAPLRFGAIAAGEWCQQMTEDGHEASLWASGFDDSFSGLNCQSLPGPELEDPGWWSQQGFDLVMFYSLRGFDLKVLRAAKQSGATVVIECDSDGFISPRQAPLRFLGLRWDPQLPAWHRLRSLKAAIDEWADGKRLEDRFLGVMDAVDWIKIESEGPAGILKELLRSCGRLDLVRKVVVIPFAVRRNWTEGVTSHQRAKRIVVAGRLGAFQKDPVRLARVLSRIGQGIPEVEVQVHVRGEAPELERSVAGLPGARLFRDSSAQVLAEVLQSCQILLSVSRWETTPVQGLEALNSGCTLVAPAEVPGYASIIEGGRFGRTFRRGGEVNAIKAELDAWECGERNPRAIAETWRKRCALDVVCAQICALRTKIGGT